ncbi:MAG TPA: DUF4386 domain-containing protein [Blastocatellia bacterium]|nr:DUF4386 domain-containing protein [Blastocatellia bacterium]
MTTSTISESQCKSARVAGVLYLLMAISAPIGLIYVPGKLMVPGDAAATVDRLRASESLLRFGIGSELFHQAVAIFLVLALYRLFKAVNEKHAVLMVILGALVSVPIVFLNVLNEIAALILVSGADFLSVFGRPQLDALAYLFLRMHEEGLIVASIFWGLWLFPFGMLVIRSGFIPRVLGILMIIAGVGYVAGSFTSLLLPGYTDLVGQLTMVLGFGELPFIFWLWIWGVRLRPSDAPAAESAGG